jgi:hypothetical protein
MSESAKKFLERAAYVIFFVAAVLAVRTYKASRKPLPTPVPPASAEDVERTRKLDELRKGIAEFDAKEAAGHAARVKRLGEAGAKAQEDRCVTEMIAAFRGRVHKNPDVKTPDCDE